MLRYTPLIPLNVLTTYWSIGTLTVLMNTDLPSYSKPSHSKNSRSEKLERWVTVKSRRSYLIRCHYESLRIIHLRTFLLKYIIYCEPNPEFYPTSTGLFHSYSIKEPTFSLFRFRFGSSQTPYHFSGKSPSITIVLSGLVPPRMYGVIPET